MRKSDRQTLLKELLEGKQITKQEEFVTLLNEQGIEVTQATISRDIKEMKMVKVSNEDGSFYYSLSSCEAKVEADRLDQRLVDAVLTFEQMDKFLVLKTKPGNAGALGILLEQVYAATLFTLLATDDKVLMIFRTEAQVGTVYQKLVSLIYG